MFTQKIIDSDAFLDMPLSSQALYFHLNMRADDDGFVNNPKRIQRTIGACDDDLKLLCAKRFIIGFETGVIVIKHWRMHNTLRKDRYNPTQYQEELALLEVKDNNAYTERIVEIPDIPELPEPIPESVATTWQPNGNQLATQYSIGKYSLDKVSIEDNTPPDSDESDQPEQPKPQKGKAVKRKHGEFQNVLLTDKEVEKLADDFGTDQLYKAISFLDAYIEEKGYKSKSHNLAIRRWVMDAVRENESKQQRYTRKETKPNWMQPSLELGEEEMNAIKRMMGTQTVENNPAIALEAEAMQQRMREKYGRKEA